MTKTIDTSTLRRFGVLPLAALAACSQTPVPMSANNAPPAGAIPANFQFYGSAEAGALSQQAFHALIAFAKTRVDKRPKDSVVLAAGAPLVKGDFIPCGDKPFAVVFDVDETMVRNLGIEARAARGEAFDTARWNRWMADNKGAVDAMPGAGHAVEDLRKLGVTVIFNTNRSNQYAVQTAAMLDALKLGPAVHNETLFLQGDVDGKTGKDGRRLAIAAKYCVIAMAGDQLIDFSDRFTEFKSPADRRATAVHSRAAGLWGKGWFVLPNAVYGSALQGGLDDAFPLDKRWNDDGAGK
ncbi:MAG TPA: HAD family acid phosphatase [Sphingomonas sp.]|jgi:5'-nucleotidase (lipoprotein e(P4) family)|nr:HAD family acid phosphatase [Sphingomonas sp.]